MPNVCGFSFDSHVAMLDWGATRSSPLKICRYTTRSSSPNCDGADRNTRWAFRPKLTFWVQNNLVHCRSPFQIAPVPSDTYMLLHYRRAKPDWANCAKQNRQNDTSILKYESTLVDRILGLPLKELLQEYDKYALSMINWKKT
ncbi:hypothetical protein BsWGS_16631 [Bradybaena similaris]